MKEEEHEEVPIEVLCNRMRVFPIENWKRSVRNPDQIYMEWQNSIIIRLTLEKKEELERIVLETGKRASHISGEKYVEQYRNGEPKKRYPLRDFYNNLKAQLK